MGALFYGDVKNLYGRASHKFLFSLRQLCSVRQSKRENGNSMCCGGGGGGGGGIFEVKINSKRWEKQIGPNCYYGSLGPTKVCVAGSKSLGK